MNFDEFQHLARLYVVGALDDDEMEQFVIARADYANEAEQFLLECQKLNAAFALSLNPVRPKPETKSALMDRLRREIGKATDRA
jgi:hypothetical protein